MTIHYCHQNIIYKLIFFLLLFVIFYDVNATSGDILKNYNISFELSQQGKHQQALIYTKYAAFANYAPAQHNLGLSYLNGLGVSKDENQAFFWFGRAAKQLLPDAQAEVAMAYYLGRGVKKDLKKAKYFWLLAAKANDEYAQFNLASLYYEQGDIIQTKYWLEKAKQNQHPQAEITLNSLLQ